MSAYSKQVKSYVAQYQKEHGNSSGLVEAHDVAAWAVANGLHKPNTKTLIDMVAADISRVFREEYRTDVYGREYRANHAVKEIIGKKQMVFWGDMDDAAVPRNHFVKSFAQRRKMIVGDCVQLKTDVDVYNGKFSKEDPIQVVLDFTDDVNEEMVNIDLKKAS